MKISKCFQAVFCGTQKRNLSDYETMEYNEATANKTNQSRWHSTKLETFNQSVTSNSLVYSRWHLQVQQQTQSLIKSGYYDDTDTYYSQSPNCSCCFCSNASLTASTSDSDVEFPSSLVTNTLQSQTDKEEFHTATEQTDEVFVCFS